MKLAYIISGYPYPLTSGRLRQYHLLKHLRSQVSAKLICVSPDSPDDETRHALAEIAETVSYVSSAGLQNVDQGELQSAKLQLRDQLTKECNAHAAEAIVTGSSLPLVCLPAADLPLAVDFCDAEWFKALETARLAPLLQSMKLRVRAYRTRRYERRLARRADHAFFAAQRDAERVVHGLNCPFTVLPNGVDTEFWQRTTAKPGPNTVLYAGAFSYRPNIDAAHYLATEVMPQVRKSCPDVRLVLAGRDPTPELQALHNPPQVEVTGFVEDIRPYYERASVFVAPLRVAGGIQNKLLEAMALEIPIVTTNKGVGGLGLTAEELSDSRITVCDTSAETALATCEVLAGGQSSAVSNNRSREIVTARFSWQHAANTMLRVLKELIGERRSASV